MASMPPDEESHIPRDTEADTFGDAELIGATRDGDTNAYGLLYERHVHAARRLSRILARDSAEADDLVSESFAKVLTSLRAGQGPTLAFRAYLLTTLRHTFYDRTQRDTKVEFTDDMSRHDSGQEFVDTAVAGQERRYAARAFHRLPERWQVVLWHTEVEGDSASQIAPLLGLTPNAVAALAYRARERLRQMYLQEHIADSPAENCRWTSERLGARVRGGLSTKDVTRVDDHLDECAACKVLFVELTELNSGLRGVLAPIVLGIAAPAYLGDAVLKGAVAAGWFTPIAEGFRSAFDWVRRGWQRLGNRNAAIGAGTVAAAAVLAILLVGNNTSPPPDDPPPQAIEPGGDDQPPPDSEDDPPQEDPPPDEPPPQDDPPPEEEAEEEDEESEDPDPEPEDPDEPPQDFIIDMAPDGGELSSGSLGGLPIEITAPETTETANERAEALNVANEGTSLVLQLPSGMNAPGGDAGDGWWCAPSFSDASCSRDVLPPGETTVAEVPIFISPTLSGTQEIPVTVESPHASGSTTLQVPVEPWDPKPDIPNPDPPAEPELPEPELPEEPDIPDPTRPEDPEEPEDCANPLECLGGLFDSEPAIATPSNSLNRERTVV